MGPVATPQHQQQAATPPPPQHVSQIDVERQPPLLDQDTLKQLIRQFLPAGLSLSKPWTADDRAKLDTFLLPHSWAMTTSHLRKDRGLCIEQQERDGNPCADERSHGGGGD